MSLPQDCGGRGGGDDPGYPFNNNNNNGHFDKDDPYQSNKKRGRPKDDNAYSNTPLLQPSPSEDATAAETSIGSDSVMSGITNPSNVNTMTPAAPAAATAAAGVVVAAAVDQNPNNNNNAITIANNDDAAQLATVDEQRRRLLRQLRSIGIATGSSFVVAILCIIPLPFLMAFLVCTVALIGLLYKLYQTFLFELNLLMQGRGIGNYLPASIYEQLTQTSLHEYMSDRSYVNENAYLMLYMIPGLSRDQIDAYVGRLAPRHQNTLHRRGLGNFLGPAFMRLIVGDVGLRTTAPTISASAASSTVSIGADDTDAATTSSPVVPRRLVLPPTIPEEGADDTSDLGEEDDPTNVPVPSVQVHQQQQPAGTTNNNNSANSPVSTSPMTQSSQQQDTPLSEEAVRAEAEAEEQVIYDAIGSAIATYMGVAAGMVQSSARRSASLFSGNIFRASMSMTMLGVGVSIYGFWTGVYNPQTFFRPTMHMIGDQMSSLLRSTPSLRPQFPSSNVLVSSTLLSGATAGIMLLFQIASVSKPPEQDDGDQNGEKSNKGDNAN
jgi:hypothetical protein